jgi:hypothetical protein
MPDETNYSRTQNVYRGVSASHSFIVHYFASKKYIIRGRVAKKEQSKLLTAISRASITIIIMIYRLYIPARESTGTGHQQGNQ